MTDAAVFQAHYSDWKLIRTRGCVQVVFEIPLEAADQAYQSLGGMPDPGKERWFAIARLESGAFSPPDREAGDHPIAPSSASRPRKPIDPEKRLAQQAGIACADPVFQQFLLEHDMIPEKSEEQATLAVRLICGVQSRAEIIPGSKSADKWDRLYGQFLAWREAPEFV